MSYSSAPEPSASGTNSGSSVPEPSDKSLSSLSKPSDHEAGDRRDSGECGAAGEDDGDVAVGDGARNDAEPAEKNPKFIDETQLSFDGKPDEAGMLRSFKF